MCQFFPDGEIEAYRTWMYGELLPRFDHFSTNYKAQAGGFLQ